MASSSSSNFLRLVEQSKLTVLSELPVDFLLLMTLGRPFHHNETPLPEYLVAVDNTTHRVSCWIPSEEGKPFTVFWRDHGGEVDTCSFITLDGLVVAGRFLFGTGIASRGSVRSSRTGERPFVFQKYEQDDKHVPDNANKDMGMIKLRIKRIERASTQHSDPIRDISQSCLGKRKVGDMCIGFGEEEQASQQYPITWSVKPYDPVAPGEAVPPTYVTFIFRYRSRAGPEFLESQGILTESEAVPKRTQGRRVVSMPSALPATGPPRKKPRLSGAFPHRGSGHPERSVTEVSYPNVKYPGEGLLFFSDGLGKYGGSAGSAKEESSEEESL